MSLRLQPSPYSTVHRSRCEPGFASPARHGGRGPRPHTTSLLAGSHPLAQRSYSLPDAISSPARSPVPRWIGERMGCGHLLSLISTLADSAGCRYICLRSGLPASHRLSQSSGDSQQPLGNVHTLPCFLLCLGPLFCFSLARWLRAR
jgi:hypothetical protein